MSNKEPTIQDIIDSMDSKQRELLYDILGRTLEGKTPNDSVLHVAFRYYDYTKEMKDITRYLMEKAKDERRKLIKVTHNKRNM